MTWQQKFEQDKTRVFSNVYVAEKLDPVLEAVDPAYFNEKELVAAFTGNRRVGIKEPEKYIAVLTKFNLFIFGKKPTRKPKPIIVPVDTMINVTSFQSPSLVKRHVIQITLRAGTERLGVASAEEANLRQILADIIPQVDAPTE